MLKEMMKTDEEEYVYQEKEEDFNDPRDEL